jgi:hypothetical protein
MKNRLSILLAIIAVVSTGFCEGSTALAEPSQIVAFSQADFQMANVPDGTMTLFKSVNGDLSGFVKKRLPPRRIFEGRDIWEKPEISGRVIEGHTEGDRFFLRVRYSPQDTNQSRYFSEGTYVYEGTISPTGAIDGEVYNVKTPQSRDKWKTTFTMHFKPSGNQQPSSSTAPSNEPVTAGNGIPNQGTLSSPYNYPYTKYVSVAGCQPVPINGPTFVEIPASPNSTVNQIIVAQNKVNLLVFQANRSFSGNWSLKTKGGSPFTINLTQEGQSVRGTYSPNDGKIDGVISSDGRLTYRWSDGRGNRGAGFFYINDAVNIEGSYSLEATPNVVAGSWSGQRQN